MYESLGCMYICAWLHLCTAYMPVALSGQKRVLDSLKLVLWMVVSHHFGAGDQT